MISKRFHAEQRRDSEAEAREMTKQLNERYDKGAIEDSVSGVSNNLKMVPKQGTDKLRLCTNYWDANNEIEQVDEAIGSIQAGLRRLGDTAVFSVTYGKVFGSCQPPKRIDGSPRSRPREDFFRGLFCRSD